MDLSPPIMQTRGRSRSKTPFLRSSCDRELCAHAGEDGHVHKKSPLLKHKHKQIATIIEEETDISRQHINRTNKQNTSNKFSSATTTSDYSSNSSEDLSHADITPTPLITDISPEIINTGNKNTRSSFVTKTTTTVTTRAFRNGRILGESENNNISKESLQNERNSTFEENSKIKTSTPINYADMNQKKTKIKKISDEFNGDLSDHMAYEEYRQAGEYWKKFPKTDYTYSKLSPHRRELAPGVVAMPNMSRQSLEKHNERVNYMIEKNPEQEEFIRKRYLQSMYAENRQHRENRQKVNELMYDSQDEVDLIDNYNKQNNMYNYTYKESWLTRFISTIVTSFNKVTNIFSNSDNVDKSYLYQTEFQQQGFGSSLKSTISTAIFNSFSYLYLLISSMLYFDTWLLRSSNAENKTKKRFLLLLLILLPFLLLAAWNLLEEKERQQLTLRYQSLVPFSLIGLRSSLSSWKDNINSYNFNLLWPFSGSTNYNYATITNNIQKSLSTEEYDNLINHINSYVQKMVDDKLHIERQERDKNISPEIAALIANIVRENIISFQSKTIHQETVKVEPYILTDADIQRIIAQIQIKLTTLQYPGPIVLTKENLDEISRLIQHNIEINNQHFNIIENIDINEILQKILESPKLGAFIDSRILKFQPVIDQVGPKVDAKILMNAREKELINNQQNLIDRLNAEISFIKLNLAEKLGENQDLHYSITLLQNAQNEIADRLRINDLNINGRFDNLLADIDKKLANLNAQQFELINRQVKINLIEILGYGGGSHGNINLDEIDLQNWIRNMFVAKSVLEDRLNELNLKIDNNLKSEIDKSGVILFKDISDKLKVEILKVVESRQKELISGLNVKVGGTAMSEDEIKKIVKNVLAIYDADKTGLVDYALESAGGQILSTRCTENYHVKSAQISVFGFPLWYPSNTPRTAISPAVQPGECWAFQGFPGYLVLKLNTMVFVSGFTLEHIPRSLAPSGKIDSAPKNFSVWGLSRENDDDPVLFGEYEYTDDGISLQYFAVDNKNIDRPFEIVELRIESNHGNVAYTCLYRFRVHGRAAATSS